MHRGSSMFGLSSLIHCPSAVRLEADEYSGIVSVSVVPCSIFDKSGFILRTDPSEEGRSHHPKTIIDRCSFVVTSN